MIKYCNGIENIGKNFTKICNDYVKICNTCVKNCNGVERIPRIRAFFGMKALSSGVLLVSVYPHSSTCVIHVNFQIVNRD